MAAAQLQGCRRDNFPQTSLALQKITLSYSITAQVALHPTKINISLFIFPKACKGHMRGVKSHSKLIMSIHKHKA